MIATQNAADKTQKFLDDFKVSKPVIGLPGLGWDTPEMAAAVSNAGGLGVLHIGFKTEEEIERDVAKVRSLTDEPFAVLMFPQKESILDAEKLRLQDTALSPLREDLGCTAARPISAPLFDNQFRKIVELKVPAVGLRLGGLREPYMEELEANGISVFGIASNLRDAKVLVSSGVNAVVAAGWAEEGLLSHEEIGKDQAEIDSLVLWSECARALRVPVLGAGSVTTQNQVRVIKALGLAGFMLSDALLLAKESPIPDSWRTKVMYLADSASETSDTFMGRASRYLSNGLAQIFPEKGLPVLQLPYQYFALKDIFDKALEIGRIDLALLEVGQYVYLAESGTTADIINKFCGYWSED